MEVKGFLLQILIVASIALALGCATVDQPVPQANCPATSTETELVTRYPSSKTIGAVLLVHGLNSKPSLMDPLAEELNRTGYGTVQVTLAGHEANSPREFDSSRQWIADVESGYWSIKKSFPDQPIYALAYSTGAVALLATEAHCSSVQLSGRILLAPAIHLRSYTKLVRLVGPLGYFDLSLPSLAPESIRSSRWVPINMYNALFELSAQIKRSVPNPDTPTIVFQRRQDEFVQLFRYSEWLKKLRLNSWTVVELGERPARDIPHHLILSADSLGEVEWQRMVGDIYTHLRTNSAR